MEVNLAAALRRARRQMNDFYPITEEDAMAIVERIRRESAASG
jgi:hypothetical protein